ncbi:MAG TPA: STAS domain-containing protein [Candidatus Latescibacteria bacterium]|nr:STAS domain-containing protein [Sedimentisphaerales bacterium]HQI77714.1 STAS domain-containing protein [Candidatus Latescibacterota bacterium]
MIMRLGLDLTGFELMRMKEGLDIAREGNVAVATFKSPCVSDSEEITNASAQLREYIASDPPRRMVFDFHGVKFFSSQVLGLLLEARAHLRPHSGEVAITSLSPQLQRVFKITNLDKIFRFYPDRASAVRLATAGNN